MRNIDEIIADTQKASESSLREAYEAGRSAAAADLKHKVSTFFAEIMAPFEAHQDVHQEVATPAPVEEHHNDGQHVEGHYN